MSTTDAIRADIGWAAAGDDPATWLGVVIAHCEELLTRDGWHLANAQTMAAMIVELRGRVAELESRVVPGRFYKCGCPVLVSSNWKAFCDTHCKVIREEEGT